MLLRERMEKTNKAYEDFLDYKNQNEINGAYSFFRDLIGRESLRELKECCSCLELLQNDITIQTPSFGDDFLSIEWGDIIEQSKNEALKKKCKSIKKKIEELQTDLRTEWVKSTYSQRMELGGIEKLQYEKEGRKLLRELRTLIESYNSYVSQHKRSFPIDKTGYLAHQAQYEQINKKRQELIDSQITDEKELAIIDFKNKVQLKTATLQDYDNLRTLLQDDCAERMKDFMRCKIGWY